MSWYRRASAPGLKGGRRRSSAGFVASTGRRCSLSTTTTRIRSNSKGYVGRDLLEDDIELLLPPVEEMPRVTGYEDVTFEPCSVPPPVPSSSSGSDTPEEIVELKPFTELPRMSGKELRTILIRYADSKCPFDKGAARDMTITGIEYRPGYKYTMESFTEVRHVAWSFEPYTGGPLDEVDQSQPPPPPWDLDCSLPKPFTSHSLILDVPHTDVLMTCHVCGGVGSKRCSACNAAGWERCSLCLGDGQKISLQGNRERCLRCLGTGRKKCWKCAGETIAICRGCSGTGQIRCFVAVTITWSNHTDTDILEPSESFPINDRLEYVNGHLVFQDERPKIFSTCFPVEDLQVLAFSLLEKHKNICSDEKLLLQRHGVWAIPVHCVTYEWKLKDRMFFVYGSKNEVHAPGYPESYCCCVVS